jgi:hypothetical protein
MEIEQKRAGSTVLLRLTGKFGESAPEFDALLRRLIEEGEVDIVVDLSVVGEFRPTRILTQAEQYRRDQGGMHRLAIVATPGSPAADRLMMNGMSKIIPIFDTGDAVRDAWETDGFPA